MEPKKFVTSGIETMIHQKYLTPLKTSPININTKTSNIIEKKKLSFPSIKPINLLGINNLSYKRKLDEMNIENLRKNGLEISGNRKLLSTRLSQTNKDTETLNQIKTPSMKYVLKSSNKKLLTDNKKSISYNNFQINTFNDNKLPDTIVNKQGNELDKLMNIHKMNKLKKNKPLIFKLKLTNKYKLNDINNNLHKNFIKLNNYKKNINRTNLNNINKNSEKSAFNLTIQKIKVFSKKNSATSASNRIVNRKSNFKLLEYSQMKSTDNVEFNCRNFNEIHDLRRKYSFKYRKINRNFNNKKYLAIISSINKKHDLLHKCSSSLSSSSSYLSSSTPYPCLSTSSLKLNYLNDSFLTSLKSDNDRKDSKGTTLDIDSDSIFSIESKDLWKAVSEIRQWFNGKNNIKNIIKFEKSLIKSALSILINNCSKNDKKTLLIKIHNLLYSLKNYMRKSNIKHASNKDFRVERSDGTIIPTEILKESITIEDIDALRQYTVSCGLSNYARASLEGVQDWAEGYLSTNMLSQILRNKDNSELIKMVDSLSKKIHNQKIKDLTSLIKYLSGLEHHIDKNVKEDYTTRLTNSLSKNKQTINENQQYFLNPISQSHGLLSSIDEKSQQRQFTKAINKYQLGKCLMKFKHRRLLEKILFNYAAATMSGIIQQSNYPQSLSLLKYHHCSEIFQNIKEMDLGRHLLCFIENLPTVNPKVYSYKSF